MGHRVPSVLLKSSSSIPVSTTTNLTKFKLIINNSSHVLLFLPSYTWSPPGASSLQDVGSGDHSNPPLPGILLPEHTTDSEGRQRGNRTESGVQ